MVFLPLAVALALDAYRNLGHALSGRYLVTRSGTLRRSTAALERAGVIGWTVKQSYFQRRAGLLTLTATTAAGRGGLLGVRHGRGRGPHLRRRGRPRAAGALPGAEWLERDVRPGP